MSAEFETIASLLLKLDVGELAEVRARCGILSQAGGAPRSTASAARASAMPGELSESDEELVLGEIVGHMYSEGIEYSSMKMLRGMNNYRSFVTKVGPVMIYFRRITNNKVKLRALIRMSIRMLYRDLAKMNVSASTRTMMNHWHRIPAVINANFPGYAKAGLLSLLIRDDGAAERYASLEVIERK